MKVLIAGDFCPQNRVEKLFQSKQFNKVLGEVKPIVEQVDYAIVNLECPVCQGEERPILKCGPRLKCDFSGMEAIKWAGFDCVTLANNHFLDYGEEGVKNTLDTAKKYGIDTVGGGNNLKEAARVLYKEIDGQMLAIINCCEHEFSIATEITAGSNPLNAIQQYYSIKEARQKSDYVIVIVHGGHEHYQLPSPRMQNTYRFFIDAGADIVVNHHQHCYSGYEIYKDKPIFYGLGNFCFDASWKTQKGLWNVGYMLSVFFQDSSVKYEIYPYNQCSQEPKVNIINEKVIHHDLEQLNSIINNSILLNKEINNYYNISLKDSNLVLEPISNRYIRALQHRGILPKWKFGRKVVLRLYNFLLCEAHKDKICFFLESEYRNLCK